MKIGAKTKLPSLLWSAECKEIWGAPPPHPFADCLKRLPENLKNGPKWVKMTKNSVVGAKKIGINGYTPSPFADQIFGKVEIWGFSGRTPPRLRLWVNMGHFGTCSWIDRDKKSRLSSIRTTRWTNATHFFVFCPLSLGQMVHAILCLRVDHIVDKHDTFFILLISFFLWSWVKYFSQFFVSMWWTPLWCQTPLWQNLTFL